VVDRAKAIDGKQIIPGDVLLALPSVGLHTNGYSLARKLFLEVAGYNVNTKLENVGLTVGQALLQPHVSYLGPVEGLLDSGVIKGLAHITGGGLTDNIPRILPAGTAVTINKGSWPVLPIFSLMQELGSVPEPEMFRTFNMGVGMVIACTSAAAGAIKEHFSDRGESCYEIGRVTAGDRTVTIA
jgi:phosphoribosylformylglycinamidine cyclo-ligase